MIFGDLSARDRDIGLKFDAVVGVAAAQRSNQFLDRSARFTERHGRGDADVEKQVGTLGRPAGAPGMAALDRAQVDHRFLTSIGGLFLPGRGPLQHGRENGVHAADGVFLLPTPAEARMHVRTMGGDANPERAVVPQDKLHVGWLSQDAHVRDNTVVDQVVAAHSVAAVLLAHKVVAPLGFFNLAGHRRDDDVALEFHPGALQRLGGLDVADQRALHVVDTQAIDGPVLDHRLGLEADAGQVRLSARVGGIHVAVEHEALAPAAPFQQTHHVGPPFFHLLPTHRQSHLLHHRAHVAAHFSFFTGRAGNVDEVARHRDDLLLVDVGEDGFCKSRTRHGTYLLSYTRNRADRSGAAA